MNSALVPVLVVVGVLVFVAVRIAFAARSGRKARAAGQAQPEPTDGGVEEDSRRLAYRYLDDMIFVHGNTVWTAVSLPSMTDEHMPDAAVHRQVYLQSAMVAGLVNKMGRSVECHLRLVKDPIDHGAWAEDLIRRAPDPTRGYVQHTRRIAAALNHETNAKVERVLLVCLGRIGSKGTPGPRPLDVTASAISGVVEDPEIHPEMVAYWTEQAEEVHHLLGYFGASRAPRSTIVRLIRKPLHGHLPFSDVPNLGTRPWGRGDFELIAGMTGRNGKNHLALTRMSPEGQPQESYTTVLVQRPGSGDQRFSRTAAMTRHALAFDQAPVDISWRFIALPGPEMKSKIDSIYGNLRDESDNMERNGADVSGSFLGKLLRAQEASERASGGDLIGMEGAATFSLSAPTLAGLNRAATAFTTYMATAGIDVWRPDRLQYRLVEALLPGGSHRLALAPWRRLSDVDMLGLSLPTAGTDVGDRPSLDPSGRDVLGWVGRYIGWSAAASNPVHNDLHVGPGRNMAGGVAVVGGSGGGKSSLALMNFHFESEAGRRCLALDPKEDFARMIYYLSFGHQVTMPGFDQAADDGTLGAPGSPFQPTNPTYWADSAVIDLLRSEDGSLDPWAVARTVADGETLAESVLEVMLSGDDWRIMSRHIRRGIAAVMGAWREQRNMHMAEHGCDFAGAESHIPRPSMWQVYQALEAMVEQGLEANVSERDLRDEIDARDRLASLARMPVSRVVFGRDPKPLSVSARRRIAITMRGLATPDTVDSSEWGLEERISAGVMHLVVEMAQQMLANSDDAKALFVDEAYMITATKSGKNLLRRAIKQGRSYNTVTVVITQQADDLTAIESEGGSTAGGANQFHEVFVFRQRSEPEARSAVALLGLDPQVASNLDKVIEPALSTGTCLFRDADNRVATVKIDQMYVELAAATETNADRRKARQSVPCPADVDDWTFIGQEALDEPANAHDYEQVTA